MGGPPGIQQLGGPPGMGAPPPGIRQQGPPPGMPMGGPPPGMPMGGAPPGMLMGGPPPGMPPGMPMMGGPPPGFMGKGFGGKGMGGKGKGSNNIPLGGKGMGGYPGGLPPWHPGMGGPPPPGMMMGGPPPGMMMGGPPGMPPMMRPPEPYQWVPPGMPQPQLNPNGHPQGCACNRCRPGGHGLSSGGLKSFEHTQASSSNYDGSDAVIKPVYKLQESDKFWSVHQTDGGGSVVPGARRVLRFYFYNAKTKDSTWEKPPGFTGDATDQSETEPRPMTWEHLERDGEKTAWVVVTTLHGTVYFCNKEADESHWVMPEQVAELLRLKAASAAAAAAAAEERIAEEMAEEAAREAELPRGVAHSVLLSVKEGKSANDEYRQKIEKFKQMLDDCGVAAFSSW